MVGLRNLLDVRASSQLKPEAFFRLLALRGSRDRLGNAEGGSTQGWLGFERLLQLWKEPERQSGRAQDFLERGLGISYSAFA